MSHQPVIYYPAYVRVNRNEAQISPRQSQVRVYPARSYTNYREPECCCQSCCKICASNVLQDAQCSHELKSPSYSFQRAEPVSQCGLSCSCQRTPNRDQPVSFLRRNTIIRSRKDQLEALMEEMSDSDPTRNRYLQPMPYHHDYFRTSSKYHHLYRSAFTTRVVEARAIVKPKRFPCMYCDKSFGKSSHLRDHVRTHTGERPFRCSWCNKAFTQYSNLRTHMRIHTGEKPYSCKYCLKSFTQAVTLRSHLRTHNDEEENTEEH